jgi:hypothetical protein
MPDRLIVASAVDGGIFGRRVSAASRTHSAARADQQPEYKRQHPNRHGAEHHLRRPVVLAGPTHRPGDIARRSRAEDREGVTPGLPQHVLGAPKVSTDGCHPYKLSVRDAIRVARR